MSIAHQHHLFARSSTDIGVQAQDFDAGDLRDHGRVSALLGGEGFDQVLFCRGLLMTTVAEADQSFQE